MIPRELLALCVGLALLAPVSAQNCGGTSVGLTPIDDLGAGIHGGFEGGLYPMGQNVRPAAHEAAGQGEVAAVQPLDAAGNPDPAGKVVLVSIGMSNTTQEFSEFVTISDNDPNRHPSVVVVDGAQGGQSATIIANPNANYWNVVDQRLAQAGVTPAQVQVMWVKQAVAGPSLAFPADAIELQGFLQSIVQNIAAKYPNCRLCYLSSRIYAGYAVTALNPEPFAYQSAFAVKWLIENQIDGDPDLNFDATAGPRLAPWLSWGPYLWADGLVPRSDGLIWECGDFAADGTHPGPAARMKVANMLHGFFTSDSTTTPWYVDPNGPNNLPAATIPYGSGCPGTDGIPHIITNELPTLGNQNFAVGVTGARPGAVALLAGSFAPASISAGPCTILLDPTLLFAPTPGFAPTVLTNPNGNAPFFVPIPNDPLLDQASVFVQWFVYDPLGAGFPAVGGAALSRGLELRFAP